MTLDGTNTWVLVEPGSPAAVVVDPGPADADHLDRVLAMVADLGASVELVVVTHGHADHTDGLAALRRRVDAPVLAVDHAWRAGTDEPLDGAHLEVGGLRLQVLRTPGHTADSLCLVLPDDAAVLTGDTVLGRGPSVVAHPDGRLGPYLASLRRLRALADVGTVQTLLVGHGPVRPDAADALDALWQHRQGRLAEVRAAVRAGATSVDDVVAVVYAAVDPVLWPAAARSVAAQLAYLAEQGEAPPLEGFSAPGA
jgi:glyoxylase-like metal-dependent hydrolase (beta-lactamase superfamily II)